MSGKKSRSIWFCLVAIIIMIVLAGCSEEPKKVANAPVAASTEPSASPTEPAATSSESVAEPSKSAEPENIEFSIGDSAQLEGYVLTVTKATKSMGGEFDKPKDGHEYVIVSVTIENAGKDNINYNPFDFKMANSQGQITDQAFTITDTDTRLESGELAPGGKVSGTIAFEQPKDDAKLQLQYKPSFWDNQTIKFNLQ